MDKISDNEIKESYEALSACEFFECDYDMEDVRRILGDTVARDYDRWIYLNLK